MEKSSFIFSYYQLSFFTGVVNFEKHESLGGFYRGVDPMGLFWSLESSSTNTVY